MHLKLYKAKGSNSSQRVEWLLNYKQVTYKAIDMTSESFDKVYHTINPFAFVPALVANEFVISESMAIIEYIEEYYPEPTLIGRTPEERASVRRICEYVNSGVHAPQNRTALSYWKPELDESAKQRLRGEWIAKCLQKLQPLMCTESGYAVGTHFTAADIFVASIYKKALAHGTTELPFFSEHLQHLRDQPQIAAAEPE